MLSLIKEKKELFSLLDSYAIVVSPKQKVDVCGDKKDNFLLEVALEGKVKYLVTGDEDLLVLKTFHGTKIIEPKEFEDILKSGKE
jgi:Predicted nucleic acid-binding protein, contains PIN domain